MLAEERNELRNTATIISVFLFHGSLASVWPGCGSEDKRPLDGLGAQVTTVHAVGIVPWQIVQRRDEDPCLL